jgi:hypothetical protein
MIPQEEMTATAGRLTDALTAAAEIMPPDEARALSSPVPGQLVSPAARPARRRMGRLRVWLVPVGVAAIVAAIILGRSRLRGRARLRPRPAPGPASPLWPGCRPIRGRGRRHRRST